MATLTVQNVAVTGLVNPTFSAAAGGGDDFPNDGKTILIVANGSGGSITVTFNDTGTQAPAGANAFDPDVDVAVPAGQDAYIGPFPSKRFGGSVGVSYSGVTSLTVAALRVG